jgi:biopolymer transport protein TolR
MVTAPMMQQGIDINLPEVSAAGMDAKSDDFILTIDDLGRIYFNENTKEVYSIVSVEEKLKEAFKDKPKKEIFLKADKNIKYNYVMQVMAASQRAGVEKIGMVTETNDADVQSDTTSGGGGKAPGKKKNP